MFSVILLPLKTYWYWGRRESLLSFSLYFFRFLFALPPTKAVDAVAWETRRTFPASKPDTRSDDVIACHAREARLKRRLTSVLVLLTMRAGVSRRARTRCKAEHAGFVQRGRNLTTRAGVKALAYFNGWFQGARRTVGPGCDDGEVKVDGAGQRLKCPSIPRHFRPVSRGVADYFNCNTSWKSACHDYAPGCCVGGVRGIGCNEEVRFAGGHSRSTAWAVWYVDSPSAGHWSVDDWRVAIYKLCKNPSKLDWQDHFWVTCNLLIVCL